MCVGKEGQREPRTRSWCSTSSTRSVIVTPGTTRGAVASIAERASSQARPISSSSAGDFTRRSRFTSEEPSTSSTPGSARCSPSTVSAQARAPTARRLGRAEAARRLGEEHAPVGVLVHDDRARRRLPVQVEVDDHPRQHEERFASGREERAGDPAVRVGDVAEARQVALEAGQVLEVGGRRHEDRVEAVLFEQPAQPLAPLRILLALNRH